MAGRLVAGDNLRTLPALLAEYAGRVDLVYLDPPFGTGDAFHVRTRDPISNAEPGGRGDPPDSQGPGRRPGPAAYADRQAGGLGGFIAALAPRLELIRELLSPTGSLYLHLDARSVHAAKLLCDEIFGPASFRNHLVWVYAGRELARRRYNGKHDDILYYTRGRSWTFHPERILEPLRESSRRALSRHVDEDGRPFVIRFRDGGGFAARDEPGRTYRQPVPAGSLPRDWFTADYARKSQRTGYPTQKPEALLARLIAASSEPGDLVADLFAGSGTTPIVAASLGRRWLAGDASPAAIAATRRRLLAAPGVGGGFEVAALGDAVPTAVTLDLRVRPIPGAGAPDPDRSASRAGRPISMRSWPGPSGSVKGSTGRSSRPRPGCATPGPASCRPFSRRRPGPARSAGRGPPPGPRPTCRSPGRAGPGSLAPRNRAERPMPGAPSRAMIGRRRARRNDAGRRTCDEGCPGDDAPGGRRATRDAAQGRRRADGRQGDQRRPGRRR